MGFTYSKKKVYSWLWFVSYIFSCAAMVYSGMFWFSFLAYLFLKEFFYEYSFEVHNAFIQLIVNNPVMVMICIIFPCWCYLVYFLSRDRYYSEIGYEKNKKEMVVNG